MRVSYGVLTWFLALQRGVFSLTRAGVGSSLRPVNPVNSNDTAGPVRLVGDADLATWQSAHPGWSIEDGKLTRILTFPDFACALALANLIGAAAEEANHHPDLHVGWQVLRVAWSTHDVGGISNLDLALAERTDELRHQNRPSTRALPDSRTLSQSNPSEGEPEDEARAILLARLADVLGKDASVPLSHFAQALTHPSFANENGGDDNQRLEFLGDAVLGLCVSEHLANAHPDADEGALTRMRSSLVNSEALAAWARSAGLGDAIAFGKGARALERTRTNVLADAAEALVACVYITYGLEGARKLTAHMTENMLASPLDSRDPKSELQERVQACGLPAPRYELRSTEGPEHDATFEVVVLVGDSVLGVGRGASKRVATKDAAKVALESPAFAELISTTKK